MAANKQQNKIEYTYRYDRIFVLIVTILIVFLGLYLIFSGDEDEAVSPPASLPAEKAELIIKEKHLSVSEATPIKSHTPPVYLYYEEINVLDTFYFPLNKDHSEQKNSALKEQTEQAIKELPIEKDSDSAAPYLSKEYERRSGRLFS